LLDMLKTLIGILIILGAGLGIQIRQVVQKSLK
jgi:hypothetical protein